MQTYKLAELETNITKAFKRLEKFRSAQEQYINLTHPPSDSYSHGELRGFSESIRVLKDALPDYWGENDV